MKALNAVFAGSLLMLALSAAGCGDGTDEPDYQPVVTARGTHVLGESAATATIGAAGGELTSDDGLMTLTVPAGALATDTEITIDPITNFAPAGLGHAYRLTPEGTNFAVPATLKFVTTDDSYFESGNVWGLRIAFQNAGGIWELPADATADPAGEFVTVETEHLSDWSLVKGAVLMPMAAEVKVGRTVELGVRFCYPSGSVNDDGLAPLGYECLDELAPLVPASEWEVDGQAGGNATVGTISGSGLNAVYTAPAAEPTPNTVSVSARIDDNTLVVSHITILGEKADMTGTVDFEFTYLTVPGQVFEAQANLSLKMHDDGIDETNYDAIGTLEMKSPTEFVMGDATCTVEEAVKPVNDEYFLKILKDPLSVRWGYSEYWIYHCVGQAPFDISVQLYFFTGTGTACTTFDDVAIDDADNPAGEYTSDCSGTGPCTAEWSFASTGK